MNIEFNDMINYSIANFGAIPYGTKSVAPLMVAQPLNACEPLILPQQGDEAENQNQNLNQNQNQSKNKNQLEAPYILIERGGCSFTQKAMIAQAAGAKMAIIMDNQFDDLNMVVLSDDGFGDNVEIPTIFISQEDGQNIVNVYNDQNPVPNQVYDFFQMAISFEVQQTEVVDMKVFINPPYSGNYQLLNKFFNKYNYISDLEKQGKFVFSPVYQIFKNHIEGVVDKKADCTRNGRYCTYDQDGPKTGTGRDLINEYLYQICLQKVEGTQKWFNYLRYQHRNCHSIANIHQCANIESQVNDYDDKKIKECMYPDGSNEYTDADHQLLEEQISLQKRANIHYFPSVVINNKTYRGTLNGSEVMEAVCATFAKTSSKCKQFLEKTQKNFDITPNSTSMVGNGPDVLFIVFVVVVILVLFFLFMMFVYRRMVAKDLQKEMNAEVNQIVSQYMAFNESSRQAGKLNISTNDQEF
ncbi:hypothetical protein PPERSA_01173 [Pseudocohnilembus persalinus]|uniref:Uncharacterized protein n=1 Tax=Pseudocohnilembus persalinus TaxID=266149 RepID=A0A0V0R152_PSEPJ|nr:hypothetical protein PPERSA_01173 [Pseudocohnilembus persalinus]|eukprot:KRX08243.1 hypothetical protein PPERSA_01173 [Pseudocohnilembus persalinus]